MESQFLHWLRDRLPESPCLQLGIGDDAAILRLAGQPNVVVTTDLLTEGVDFHLGRDDPRRIGRKALAANLSDLAAMAARPMAAVVAVALPRAGGGGLAALDLAIALYEGILPLAAEYELAIAGGDTNTYDGPLVISATLLGRLTERGPLARGGGRPGDRLLVTGTLGGSILGHSFDFTPRIREALLLAERYELAAGMDISDGLALDASRLAAASGCGAVLRLDEVPISAAAWQLADDDAEAALRHALGDGEDFELLLAVAPGAADAMLEDQPLDCGMRCVGELVTGSGLWQQSDGGEVLPLEPIGWLH
jgi:thiamine-monophosphate kinase